MVDLSMTLLNEELLRAVHSRLSWASGSWLLHTSEIFLNTKPPRSIANHLELAEKEKKRKKAFYYVFIS